MNFEHELIGDVIDQPAQLHRSPSTLIIVIEIQDFGQDEWRDKSSQILDLEVISIASRRDRKGDVADMEHISLGFEFWW
ncbi:hypothetical protein L1987_49286 [Smallanthus sonchifolius]|uniref:Uncharacterized protein n=1 Tax=Smallanthus sonchifolius TaxID=185202 RepID=A0ACB9FUU4_9ASTR|nr:hypothetical protein L1987_49286 [Smallanthus sonchifolius]